MEIQLENGVLAADELSLSQVLNLIDEKMYHQLVQWFRPISSWVTYRTGEEFGDLFHKFLEKKWKGNIKSLHEKGFENICNLAEFKFALCKSYYRFSCSEYKALIKRGRNHHSVEYANSLLEQNEDVDFNRIGVHPTIEKEILLKEIELQLRRIFKEVPLDIQEGLTILKQQIFNDKEQYLAGSELGLRPSTSNRRVKATVQYIKDHHKELESLLEDNQKVLLINAA